MTEEKTKLESEKIWDEIKDLPIDMFSLPNQKVSDHVVKKPLPGNKLYVTLNSSAVITALEAAVAGRFDLEQADKYIIISRRVKSADEELAELERNAKADRVRKSVK